MGGFSQGGAVALAASMAEPSSIGGVLMLSTFVASSQLPSGIGSRLPPIHFFHGEADQVVPIDWGKRSYELLQSAGAKVTFQSYPGLVHSSNEQELADIVQ